MGNPNPPNQFEPGNTLSVGKGRPKKGYSISEWFRAMLKRSPAVRDALGKAVLKKALEGDTTAQRLIWNYMDGLPKGDLEGLLPVGQQNNQFNFYSFSPEEKRDFNKDFNAFLEAKYGTKI